jgi:hypothetical protein
MTAFSRDQPSLINSVQLFDFANGSQRWPPPQPPFDPSSFVPVQVGDPRLTTDCWHEVGEVQRAMEQERQRRELEAAEVARKQFYGHLAYPPD